MPRPVFLSYAREDSPFVEMLASGLQESGINVWWDRDIGGGRRWMDELDRRLQQASSVIVVWGPNSAASEFVMAEADYAFNAGKILPVLIDDCSLPGHHLDIQMFDLSGWQGGRGYGPFRELVSAVLEEDEDADRIDDVGVALDDLEDFYHGDELEELFDRADDGDLEALVLVAEGYLRGYGELEVDRPHAIGLLERAVDAGHPGAMHTLGDEYHSDGAFDQARRLYERSAKGGEAMAAFMLAKMYAHGEGVRVNLAQVRRWSQRYEEMGGGDADEIYANLIG